MEETPMTSLVPTRAALLQLDLPEGRVRVQPHEDRYEAVEPKPDPGDAYSHSDGP
jgi:hypothetical protein